VHFSKRGDSCTFNRKANRQFNCFFIFAFHSTRWISTKNYFQCESENFCICFLLKHKQLIPYAYLLVLSDYYYYYYHQEEFFETSGLDDRCIVLFLRSNRYTYTYTKDNSILMSFLSLFIFIYTYIYGVIDDGILLFFIIQSIYI